MASSVVSSAAVATRGNAAQASMVWPPINKKKYETLSYLPDLSDEQLLKEIEYLLQKGWVPCLEFKTEHGFVYREHHRSPGYYDGRYWTMWKLPMFGCTDATQVLNEVQEAKKAYPQAWVRIIGFDNVRQVQCFSFIAYKPEGY
ncbi:Ribulose bisphosphate carboxylase small chain 3, chloroplastic [Capsicum annuum]|nr:Ribulose bisphosphate carboxylase small chain 3, chloroplastic [Capsicum annuum]